MYLHTMDLKAWSGEQLLVAYMALEVLGLLVLKKNLLVVEFPITVPAPWFRGLLLFSAHLFLSL